MSAFVILVLSMGTLTGEHAPGSTLRIESVSMIETQPHETDPAVIWFDNFDNDAQQEQYAEKSGETTAEVRFGLRGKSLHMHYPKGSRGRGGRKVFFGDSPAYPSKTVRRDETFDDVYWRLYVKHQSSWKGGGPAKLSRATCLVPPGWRQSMIAHVWSSGESLTLDPASGVRGRQVVTTKYNDFKNLRWLGNKPVSYFKLHGSQGAGWWVCVEARAKLNSPGQNDGINQLWIDGRLQTERRGLDWQGEYTGHGINAVFLEAYWNEGSPVDQSRWIDNFVISTKPIGPVVSPPHPVFIRTLTTCSGEQSSWMVEVATDTSPRRVVWRSNELTGTRRVAVGAADGDFLNHLRGRRQLEADRFYVVRARELCNGRWSAWSDWHQRFKTKSTSR